MARICPIPEPTEELARRLLDQFKKTYPGIAENLTKPAPRQETTTCVFCVTCNMLVPQERAHEHDGHELETE